MGGSLSEEFQALCDIGEDVLAICNDCHYATNVEVCECVDQEVHNTDQKLEKELLHTPNVGTIQDLYDQYHICRNRKYCRKYVRCLFISFF